MTDQTQDFDPPRIMLVKEVDGRFDFGLLPSDFRHFGRFQMLCAGLVVRSARGFDLLTSHRSMLPAGTGAKAMQEWQERAIRFVQSQWQTYIENASKLHSNPKQQEAFDEMLNHSIRNLGSDIMSEDEIKSLEATLHRAFMAMLDRQMGLPTKGGLTGRYAMGGTA